jgi:hypothetical protein
LPRYTIITAPSILRLRTTRVEHLPKALEESGLMRKLNAEYAGCAQPSSSYDSYRDPKTQILNADAIKAFSLQLAKVVSAEAFGSFPILLGGETAAASTGPFWDYGVLEDTGYFSSTAILIFISLKHP